MGSAWELIDRAPAHKYHLILVRLKSRTDTGSSPPVFEYDALCINQFHHETYSMIGSLVVLTCMIRPVKGVGQTS